MQYCLTAPYTSQSRFCGSLYSLALYRVIIPQVKCFFILSGNYNVVFVAVDNSLIYFISYIYISQLFPLQIIKNKIGLNYE